MVQQQMQRSHCWFLQRERMKMYTVPDMFKHWQLCNIHSTYTTTQTTRCKYLRVCRIKAKSCFITPSSCIHTDCIHVCKLSICCPNKRVLCTLHKMIQASLRRISSSFTNNTYHCAVQCEFTVNSSCLDCEILWHG